MKMFKLVQTLILTFLSVLLLMPLSVKAETLLWTFEGPSYQEGRIDATEVIKKTLANTPRPTTKTEAVIVGIADKMDTSPEFKRLTLVAVNPNNGQEMYSAEYDQGFAITIVKIDSIADVNNDGVEDILVYYKTNTNSYLIIREFSGANLSPLSGRIDAPRTSAVFETAKYPSIGDFNDDKKDNDFVVITYNYNNQHHYIAAYH
ncbi:MAG: hypothetical protein HQL27_08240 [Candidatus Omnitrophica bacterium]|nr:hypothetical protein [Candidatus Omnitrophota bacterium]